VAARAVDGVGALTPPRVCVERELSAMRAPPEEPARRARYRDLLKVLADTNALLKVGRVQDAAARSARLLADARALADPPLLAEATLLDGAALAASGQADQAVARFREVVLAAAAAGEPRIEARAWCDLITLSINSGRGRPAADVIMAAEAAVARVGGDPDTDLAFAQAQAMVAIAEGHPADGEKQWRRAQGLAAAALPADHPRQSQTRMGIATALAEQHRFPEALVMLDEARTVAERTYGPDHPNLAQFWGNRAVILFELARHEESLAAAERCAAVAAPGTLYAGLGPMYKASALIALGRPSEGAAFFQAAIASFRASGNHIQEYQALLNLGLFQYSQGDTAAGPTLDEALAVGRRIYGERGGAIMYPLTVRGMIELENERFADGLARCQQAVDVGLAAFGPEDSSLAMSLLCVARAHRRLGDPRAGQEAIERALVLADRGFNPTDQSETRLELARVLLDSHGDRARARRLVEDVLTREADPAVDATIQKQFHALLR
jgi:tetratricopeptide (TPR) repeat protein